MFDTPFDALPEPVGGFIDEPLAEVAPEVAAADAQEAALFLGAKMEADALAAPAEDERIARIRERAEASRSQRFIRDVFVSTGVELRLSDPQPKIIIEAVDEALGGKYLECFREAASECVLDSVSLRIANSELPVELL